MKSALQQLIQLSIEVLISTLMFVVIALPALGLDFTLTALKNSGHFQEWTLNLITFAKYFILVIDVLMFSFYLVRKTKESLMIVLNYDQKDNS